MRFLFSLLVGLCLTSCGLFSSQFEEVEVSISEVEVISGWVNQIQQFDSDGNGVLQGVEIDRYLTYLAVNIITTFSVGEN